MSFQSQRSAPAPFAKALVHRRFLTLAGILLPAVCAIGSAHGSSLVPQTPLTEDPTKENTCIPKFAVELPVFGPAGSIRPR
jgi:hypothetical protein